VVSLRGGETSTWRPFGPTPLRNKHAIDVSFDFFGYEAEALVETELTEHPGPVL
jgi:hypothetical protein